jgi:hypothetical protein
MPSCVSAQPTTTSWRHAWGRTQGQPPLVIHGSRQASFHQMNMIQDNTSKDSGIHASRRIQQRLGLASLAHQLLRPQQSPSESLQLKQAGQLLPCPCPCVLLPTIKNCHRAQHTAHWPEAALDESPHDGRGQVMHAGAQLLAGQSAPGRCVWIIVMRRATHE